MKKIDKTMAVLTVEDAREELINFFAGILQDQASVEYMLRDGTFHSSIPKINKLSDFEVIEQVIEIEIIGDIIADSNEVDVVAIYHDYKLHLIGSDLIADFEKEITKEPDEEIVTIENK